MFETADEILRRKGMVAYDRHAISWEWEGYQPILVTYDQKAKEVQELTDQFRPGERFDLLISDARRCVGSFIDGEYEPCKMRNVVSGQFDQCPLCASTWIPVQNCVFEPECDGTNITNERCIGKGGDICAKPTHVYAAFYGDLVKVGMTLSTRFMERAIEQGADAIARLGTYPNRRAARDAENVLSKALHATQWVRKTTFLKAQGSIRDREVYQARLDALFSSLDGVATDPGELNMLDRYPLLPYEPSKAVFAEVTGRHRGEVLGCKGKWLFYRLKDGRTMLLNMSSVPSRYITISLANINKP
ncbi:MAG TPA: DUF2797 domain-containing protein [Methanomassiliicoccales archaeon]|nr:DUF2797 domain-containing protein [Methanomassiliicoccales archaeon]HPR98131.1 DUF2797 domain-containing protein [Methanomassiliicoccales archaeon]